MIFKIQKPLYGGNSYLLYNKDRTILTNSLKIGDIPEIDELFENELKIYVKGYVNRQHQIIINRLVKKQDW